MLQCITYIVEYIYYILVNVGDINVLVRTWTRYVELEKYLKLAGGDAVFNC